LIRERARVPELEYVFKHELTREAAYNGLLRGERRRYHRQVAEALERLFPERVEEQAGVLAHHWERAEEPERAVEYLLRAGEQARAAYANEEAIDYYRRVLALLDGTPLGEARRDWRLAALKGLGRVYVGIGRPGEAETSLREAIALAKEVGSGVRAVVRLYYWLVDALFWQGRSDDSIRLGEEGLALLGDDTESVEAALMNQIIGGGHENKRDWETSCEFTHRTERFIRCLPYTEEFRAVYDHIIRMYLFIEKDVEAARKWIHILESKATQHHDLRAQGGARVESSYLLRYQGDLRGAISENNRALDFFCSHRGHQARGLVLGGTGSDFAVAG
jgi:predicted ATPase